MNIILCIVSLLVIAGAGLSLILRKKEQGLIKSRSLCIVFLAMGVGLFILSQSFQIISTGKIGVRVKLGQVQTETVGAGFCWKIPFIESIKLVNIKQEDLQVNGQIWSETSERTAIYYENLLITYTIQGDKAAWIYANVTDYKNSLITGSIISSAVKSASKELNSTDATNRAKIEPLIKEKLQQSLNEKFGDEVVYINKVSVEKTDFEDAYNQAIAEKQNAQLQYETQQIQNKAVLEKTEAEAQAKIIATQGNADAKRIEAQAEADALRITAEGEAAANQTLASSLSENILTLNMLNRWNGELPKVVGDSQTMLGLDKFVE